LEELERRDELLDALLALPAARRALSRDFVTEQLARAERNDTLLELLRYRYGENLSALLKEVPEILSSQGGFIVYQNGSSGIALRSTAGDQSSSLPMLAETSGVQSLAIEERSGDVFLLTLAQRPVRVDERLTATWESVADRSVSVDWLLDESQTLVGVGRQTIVTRKPGSAWQVVLHSEEEDPLVLGLLPDLKGDGGVMATVAPSAIWRWSRSIESVTSKIGSLDSRWPYHPQALDLQGRRALGPRA
jgi:hypothetical protein